MSLSAKPKRFYIKKDDATEWESICRLTSASINKLYLLSWAGLFWWNQGRSNSKGDTSWIANRPNMLAFLRDNEPMKTGISRQWKDKHWSLCTQSKKITTLHTCYFVLQRPGCVSPTYSYCAMRNRKRLCDHFLSGGYRNHTCNIFAKLPASLLSTII